MTRSSNRTGAASQGSISAHPLFPAIVALWFAALLGIGSLILPMALFDRIAALTGDVSLGVTMRTAIALAAAIGGAGLGVVLARQVAGVSRAAPRRARESGTKRPISALDELGPEGLDEPLAGPSPRIPVPEPIPGRRRPLSVTDETGPSEFLDHAPLPGGHDAADLSGTDAPQGDDALELGEFTQETHLTHRPHSAPLSAPAKQDGRFGSGALSNAPVTDPLAEVAPRQQILRQSTPDDDAAPFAPPAPTGRPAFGIPQPVAPEAVASELAEAEPFAFDTPEEPTEPPPPVAPTASGSLHELGVAELVERFAQSLQNAAARTAPAAVSLPEPEPEPAAVPAPAPSPFAAPAFAEPHSAPFTVPAALRPIALGEDAHDDGEDHHDLTFRIAPQPAPFAAPLAETGEEEDDDDSFASLLAMRSKLGEPREAVHIEDEPFHADIEPVVVFPAPDPRGADAGSAIAADFSRPAPFAAPPARTSDPAATEAALRDALTKLQRISGAA